HRDLKPDNIMVARTRDGADLVKVVDFGIAKAVGGDEAGQKVTKTGLVVGTPEFMSPEQLSGDKVDGRSDLYSLALVYFRMLTGELPFQADSVQETMIKRLTDEPAKLAATRPDLSFPDGLQQVLDAALARTPGDRYQTVAKFADDVVAVAGLASGTRGVAPATRVDIEGKTQLMDSRETKAQAAKRAPGRTGVQAPPQQRSLVPIIIGAVVVLGIGGGGYVLLVGRGGASPAASSDTTKMSRPDTSKVSALTVDTTRHPANGQTDNRRGTHGDTTRPNQGRTTPTPLTGTGTGIDPARVGDMLDALIDKPSQVIVDSGQIIFNTAGVATGDKAFAACLIAQAEKRLQNRDAALRWAQIGLGLKAGMTSCQDVVQNPGPQ
ncbi:MAG TPA: serine/threonine-protein kinase, partial [Gemmatimonadales bacterium]|nr:serine/threonine-protein kinase [Gemmatimonadales bacterium]